MTNILTKNLDITDFFMNDQLDKIAEISENLSENSKTTDVPLLNDGTAPNDKDYALILISPRGDVYHKYAMQNRGLTELNLAFLSTLSEELPDELVKIAATNLTKAAQHFNLAIPENLKEYASDKFIPRYLDLVNINESKFITKLATKKSEPSNAVYALKNKYPITNKNQIIKSANWFDKNYNKLDIDEQQEFVENITKQAEKLNVKVASSLVTEFNTLNKEKFNDDFKAHLNIRKTHLTDDDENLEVFDELWGQKDEIGPYKVAYVLEAIDKELHLNDLYGDKILDPLRSVLDSQTKVASVLIGDKEITQAKLASLKSSDLGVIVGEGLVTDLKNKNGITIFDTLPLPMQKEIAELV